MATSVVATAGNVCAAERGFLYRGRMRNTAGMPAANGHIDSG